ncbi:MAG: ABC transporter permease, partial [Akkermansiaceae bacterium]
DLPDRFGAMTIKELRQGMRRGIFIVPFIVIQLLAVLSMLMEFNSGDVERHSDMAGMLNPALFFSSGPFWLVAGLVCILIMPLGGLALMGQELEEGNHELLLMTPLTRWKVIRGKFLALWGLCLVTFVSLMPYLIVRYFTGGIDTWRNIVMSFSVVGYSAMFAAGAIGASGYKTIVGRIAVMILFLGSMALGGLGPLMGCAYRTEGCGIFYHLNALAFAFCYTLFGLGLARSRIRLVVHQYEVKPSWMVMGLLIFTPLVAGMTTAMSTGYAGFIGLIGMGLVAWYADMTPKAPAWMKAPTANIPPTAQSQAVPPQIPMVGGPEMKQDEQAPAETPPVS